MTRLSIDLIRVTARRLSAVALATLLLLPLSGTAALGAPVQPSGVVSPTGQVERVVVVRPNRVDLFSGTHSSSVPRGPGELSLPGLARLVPEEFLKSEGDGVFRLRARLIQAPDTHLSASAPQVKVLLLDSGVNADGASLQGSGARLTLSAVTVQAVTTGTSATAEPAPTRGFVAYRGNSRLAIADTQLDHLGASAPEVEPTATGLAVSGESRLVLTRSRVSSAVQGITVNASKLEAASVTVRGARDDGIELGRGSSASLSEVTVEASGRTGLVLRPASLLNQVGPLTLLDNKHWGLFASAPAGLVLSSVTAARNGVSGSNDGGGVRLSDCNVCSLTDVTVHANHGEGLSAGGKSVQLRDIVARRNDANGIDLAGCAQCWLTEVTANMNGSSGVLLRDSREVTVERAITAKNPKSGISLRDCTACLLGDLTVSGGNAGVQVGGGSSQVTIGPGTVDRTLTGVDTNEPSGEVVLTGLTITDSIKSGVQLEARSAIVKATRVEQKGGTALSSAVAGLQVSDSRFLGADRGLDLNASAFVTRSAIRVARQGVTVDGPSTVDLSAVDIAVTTDGGVGIRSSPGAKTTIEKTRISADSALAGDIQRGAGNVLPFAPNWLGIFMVIVVCAAFGLELMRRLRETAHDRTVPAPDHVCNTS